MASNGMNGQMGLFSDPRRLQPIDLSHPFSQGEGFGGQPGYMMPPISEGPEQPAAPFVFGEGGARMTPEQLALRQKANLLNGQSDYSPVQSWTQGLGRVFDGFNAGREEKMLQGEAVAQRADQRKSVAALLSEGGSGSGSTINPAIVNALSSPDPMVQKLGTAQWERQNPKATVNDTERDYAFWKNTLSPEQFDMWIANKVNPPHFTMLPNGQMGMVGGYQPQGGSAQGMPTVSDEASYNAIPSGQQFVDPQGNVRVKP